MYLLKIFLGLIACVAVSACSDDNGKEPDSPTASYPSAEKFQSIIHDTNWALDKERDNYCVYVTSDGKEIPPMQSDILGVWPPIEALSFTGSNVTYFYHPGPGCGSNPNEYDEGTWEYNAQDGSLTIGRSKCRFISLKDDTLILADYIGVLSLGYQPGSSASAGSDPGSYRRSIYKRVSGETIKDLLGEYTHAE